MPEKTKGIRELGRELTFYALFIYEAKALSLNELLDFRWYEKMTDFGLEDGELFSIPAQIRRDVFEFAGQMTNGTVSNISRIDEIIKEHLVKWSFERLHASDKANLRVAVYALLYRFDIPPEVTIAEANELAENYSEDHASNYINGILNKIKEKFRGSPISSEAAAEVKPKKKVIGLKKKPLDNK